MRYGMDLDGVIADFSSRVVDAANFLWPGKIAPGFQPTVWDYGDVLTKDEWQRVWARILDTPYMWEDEPPMPGCDELVDYIRRRAIQFKEPDEIFFITARAKTKGDSPLVQSSHWLYSRGLWPREGFSTVIPVGEAKHKADLFRGLGLKYHLDDYAPTVEELNKIEGMHAFVLDQPWNQYATELPRVYSVTQYLDVIRDL